MHGAAQPCTDPGPESGDTSGFQIALFDINADGGAGGCRAAWTQYTTTSAPGLPQSGSGRIAFHFYAFGQGDSVTGTTIGVDSVSLDSVAQRPFTATIFTDRFDDD